MRNPAGHIIFAGLALAVMQNGQAHSAHNFWYGFAMSTCLVQDEKYALLPMGAAYAREESMVRWQSKLTPELRSCIVKAKPIPENLCKVLLSPMPNERQSEAELETIYKKYAKDLDTIGDKLACKDML